MRVLVPNIGRAVFLALSSQQLKVCLDSIYVKNIRIRAVNIGGNVGCIVVAERSSEVFTLTERGTNSSTSKDRKWDPIDDNIIENICKRQRVNPNDDNS